MILTNAVSGLQESVLQAEAELSALAEQQREKRAELRRYRKALKALTGTSLRWFHAQTTPASGGAL